MRVISASEASQNLSAAMRQTTEDHAPVLIVNQNGASCVLMSLVDYKSLEETAYLMRSGERQTPYELYREPESWWLNSPPAQLSAHIGLFSEFFESGTPPIILKILRA